MSWAQAVEFTATFERGPWGATVVHVNGVPSVVVTDGSGNEPIANVVPSVWADPEVDERPQAERRNPDKLQKANADVIVRAPDMVALLARWADAAATWRRDDFKANQVRLALIDETAALLARWTRPQAGPGSVTPVADDPRADPSGPFFTPPLPGME